MDLIREIIIGYKADTSLIGEILRYVTYLELKDVQLYLSKPDRAHWKFSHSPKAYSLCEHCRGQGYTSKAT